MGGCATKPKVLKGDEGEVPAPAPPPEPTKGPVPAVPEAKEAADVVAEGQKVVERDHVDEVAKAKDEVDEAKEILNDDNFDDQANKRQSLSNLFKENEKKGLAESDNTPSEAVKEVSSEPVQQESTEPVKQELLEPVVKQESVEPEKIESVDPVKQSSFETEELKEAPVNTNLETEKSANPIEQTVKPDFVGAPEKIETEKTIEAMPVPEPAPEVHVPETQNKETSTDNKEEKTEVAK